MLESAEKNTDMNSGQNVLNWDLPNTFIFKGQNVKYGTLGQGEPIVLLHGTPFSSVVWRRIAPYLAAYRKVYYYDLLGYGKSQKSAGQDVSLGMQNKLFAALLDHWGVQKPDVVAHDFGGTTALRTHILNARDYRTLTLVDPVAIGPSGSGLVQAATNHQTVFEGIPAYVHQAILHAYIQGAVFHPLTSDKIQAYLDPWLGESGQAAFYRQIAQMSDRYTDEIENRYNEIRCPTTILWGEQDQWIPLDRGRILAERIPNANLQVITASSHLVQEDAPEAILAAVLKLLFEK